MPPEREGLTDMRLTSVDRDTVGVPQVEPKDYSYGLVLRLENPELKKLNFKRLPNVGEEFEVVAVGKVSNVYESQSEGNRGDRAVSIQITHMKLR